MAGEVCVVTLPPTVGSQLLRTGGRAANSVSEVGPVLSTDSLWAAPPGQSGQQQAARDTPGWP